MTLRFRKEEAHEPFDLNLGGKKIQWTYIRGIYENAIYGGRVDNEFDLRILVSYLENFFTDEVLSGSSPPRQALTPGIQIPTRDSYQVLLAKTESRKMACSIQTLFLSVGLYDDPRKLFGL